MTLPWQVPLRQFLIKRQEFRVGKGARTDGVVFRLHKRGKFVPIYYAVNWYKMRSREWKSGVLGTLG